MAVAVFKALRVVSPYTLCKGLARKDRAINALPSIHLLVFVDQ